MVFALTGALVASRKQLDLVGIVFIGALTAVGGGTLRDLMLGRDPVFWVGEPGFVVLAAGPVIVVIMGIATGSFGGLMRDVVCNEVPLVLKQGELYLTCAFCGAAAALVMVSLGWPGAPALLVCGGVTFALRAGSLIFGWRLPVYKARPPRA
nr:TRIC cation channel family protein [Phaeovulum sp. NW3]